MLWLYSFEAFYYACCIFPLTNVYTSTQTIVAIVMCSLTNSS